MYAGSAYAAAPYAGETSTGPAPLIADPAAGEGAGDSTATPTIVPVLVTDPGTGTGTGDGTATPTLIDAILTDPATGAGSSDATAAADLSGGTATAPPATGTGSSDGTAGTPTMSGGLVTSDPASGTASSDGTGAATRSYPPPTPLVNYELEDSRVLLSTDSGLDDDASLSREPLRTVAISVPAANFNTTTGLPATAYVNGRAVFHDTWADSVHLVVDGVDVTRFRGQPADIVQWPLLSQDPLGYGGAIFGFPGFNAGELRSTPSAMPRGLRWARNHARAALVPVVGGVRQDPIWRGRLSRFQFTSDRKVQAVFDGDAVGALATDQRQQQIFHRKKDAGIWLYDAFVSHNLRLTPYLGATTGIVLPERGSGETYLEYVQSLLADQVHVDGSCYTVMPTSDGSSYHHQLRDTTTVHYTVFAEADGVDLTGLVRDGNEEPNTFYGYGQDPDGRIWMKAVLPGLTSQGTPPDYPIAAGTPFGIGTTNAAFDDPAADMLAAMIWKLVGINRLSRKDAPGGYDDDVAEAVKDVQEAAGLTVTGVMNPATWDAMYSHGVTGFNINNARVTPLVQKPSVSKWLFDTNGDLVGRNPAFDPRTQIVARTIQHGNLPQDAATRWSRGEMARQDGPNWAGTINLNRVDVFAGDYNHGDPDPVIVSRFAIKANRNIKVVGHDGDTLFHIAANQPQSWDSTTLTVDTQARDRKTIGEIRARNVESRRNRGRIWKQEHGQSGMAKDGRIPFWGPAGVVDTPIHLTGGRWNEFFVLAGDEGTIGKLRLHVATSAFYAAVFAQRPGVGWLQRHIGDPSAVDHDKNPVWMKESVQARLFEQRTLLHAQGTAAEPLGYAPRTHQKADGSGVTDAPVTGLHVDDSGFPFHAYGQPLLWVAIWPLADSVVRPGRIMWDQLASMS